jgi:hypothetical protein
MLIFYFIDFKNSNSFLNNESNLYVMFKIHQKYFFINYWFIQFLWLKFFFYPFFCLATIVIPYFSLLSVQSSFCKDQFIKGFVLQCMEDCFIFHKFYCFSKIQIIKIFFQWNVLLILPFLKDRRQSQIDYLQEPF